MPSPEVPGWADQFILPPRPTTEESAAHLRVMTLNCGGAQGKLSVMIGVVLSHDSDVAFLQECWDADIEGQLAFRVYVVCMSALQGPGKGMCVLMHRRLWAPEMKQRSDVLIDERSWLAVLIHRDTNVVSLLVDVHMDPEINSTAKEEILSAVGAMTDRVRPHEAMVSGDFNVPRNSKSLVERVVSKGHALSKLHIPYDRGEKTNYTSTGQAAVATEIDYILVSKHIGVAQKGVYPAVSTHMALVCALTGMGCQPAKVQKRYKHRVTTDEQKRRAARLLALYWWWMAGTTAHPDAWVACYWSIADGILPPSSHRVSAQAILDRAEGLVRKGVTQRELQAWHKEVQQHLYVCGVRMNDQVLSTVSITSHTTRAIQPATKTPRPYPQLKSRADQRQDVQTTLRTAASQLEFYHISRGQSGKQLAAWDEPHFDTILRLRALGLPTSPDDTQSLLSVLPRDPQINAYTLRGALDRGGSDTTSRDEIPVSLLAAMPHAGDQALYHYTRRLRQYPDAVSNQILQLGIYKSGLTHLFQSYRPIKLASAANSMQARVVQHEVNFRAEVDGSWAGNTFSYRKGLSPQYLALAARAIVSVALSKGREVHIVEGDESGAFDMPIREDVARCGAHWPTQCAYGVWAPDFYGRQKVRLWTVQGLAPPVVPQLGFSQGCRLAATAYLEYGKYRTRGLQYLGDCWWVRGVSLSEVVFSDDRRWFGRTAEEATRLATVAHVLSQDACAPSNQAKMNYTFLQLAPTGNIQRARHIIYVHGMPVESALSVPEVVGITLEPHTAPAQLQGRVVKSARRLQYFITKYQPNFLLAVRSVIAYLVSRIDYVAKGSWLPAQVLQESQVQVNHLFRRILALPADTPLVILHTPVVFGGWGCPQIATRAAMNFVQGYLSAIDSRSSLAQTVLREQAKCPLPLRQGDYEQFMACCTEHGVVIRTVSEPAHGSTPIVLRASLLLADALYVTTDAGRDIPAGLLQPECAGFGIVVTDGIECQEISFGVVAAAVSSSALEWLAKLIAMLILQHYRGELYMFCDNASMQVCAHGSIVTTHSWVDQLARKVLHIPVFSKIRECWLPAQHDS